MNSRLFLLVAAAVAFAVAFGATVVHGGVLRHRADAVPGWSVGAAGHGFARATGQTDLYGYAGLATFEGTRVVESSADGNFEFEHPFSSFETTFEGLTTSGAPTPIQLGRADGQNVTSLLTPAGNEQTVDIQSWRLGTAMPTGIDRYGRLRLNRIVILPLVRSGHVRLFAILPNGTVQRLQPVSTG